MNMNSLLEAKTFVEKDELVESSLVDADLYVKYQFPEKAFGVLRKAIKRTPNSISLREKMREISIVYQNLNEATEQCMALAGLYTANKEFDLAHDRLREAKTFDPRISIASGLEAIKKESKEVDGRFNLSNKANDGFALAGDISFISIFDVVEVIENACITGLLILKSEEQIASIAFNDGRIADAQVNGVNDTEAFREIIEIKTGRFEFSITDEKFPEVIKVASNKNFLLNTVASIEVERAEKMGARDLSQEEIA